MRLEYHDKKADTLYVRFNNAPYAYSEQSGDFRLIDYDANGNPIGVELLWVSNGVITNDLPRRAEVERLLQKANIKIPA